MTLVGHFLQLVSDNALVLTILSIAAGFIGGYYISYLFYKRGRRDDEEKAKKDAEEKARIAEQERLSAIAKRHGDKHWHASVQLLTESLLKRLPEQFRNDLADAIVERLFEMAAGLNPRLFRATRLFVEIRLLRSAKKPEPVLPLEAPTLENTLEKFAETLSEVHSRLTEPQIHAAIEFENCFALDALKTNDDATASSYFEALSKIDSDDTYKDNADGIEHIDRFLTLIDVTDGFVAPMYLVRGLLSQFPREWRDALQLFNQALGQDPNLFRAVQVFEFYCWLLWGPSISVCDCGRWAGDFRVLQYGYGDENNSFPLILDQAVYNESWPRIQARLKNQAQVDANGEAEPLPMAIPSRFHGRIVWGPRYLSNKTGVPNVYSVPAAENARDFEFEVPRRDHRPRRSAFEGLMLRADDNLVWNDLRSSRYYSAYVWIMFEICAADGKPLYHRPQDRWKSLFPMFEHSNVAEGQTLLFLKKRLAEKARNTVEQLERDKSRPRRFRYLCASDDTGAVQNADGDHRIHFRTEKLEDLRLRNEAFIDGQNVEPRQLFPIENQRLRNILLDILPDDEVRTRMFAPHTSEEHIITSCDLPDIIEDFYRDFLQVAVAQA